MGAHVCVDTQWYGWLSGLVAGLSYFVNILWYPILVLALTLLYFDLRVRNESLDLDVRIRQLEQTCAAVHHRHSCRQS